MLSWNNCKVQNNVSLYDGVILERVFCGPSMVFTNVYNPRSLIEKEEYRTTLVKEGRLLELMQQLYAELRLVVSRL